MNLRTFASTALILASFGSSASTMEAAPAYPIAVQATGVERADGHIYLDMLVWNCSDKQLDMDRFILPWGASLGRGLVIYQAFSGRILEQIQPIEDFPEQVYNIPAGGKVSGKIALDSYFMGLGRMKDLSGFVVFWVYQPLGKGGAPVGKKFGGMFPMDSVAADAPQGNPCGPKNRHQ